MAAAAAGAASAAPKKLVLDDIGRMFQYINYANFDKLEKSVEKYKVDVNSRLPIELDARMPTCLCAAVFPGHYTIPEDIMLKKVATKKLRDDILMYLLQHGANPDLADKNGHTPLHLAIMQNNFEYLQEMLPFAKNLDLFDDKGMSALLHALDSDDPIKYCTVLLKAGASVNAVGKQGSALHYAVLKNRRDLVEFLLKNGANVDIPAGLGRTPLHFAANEKLDGMADLLVLHGANVNAADSLKRTALHIAALKSSYTLLKYFLQQRARVDARDRDLNTPLHLAAQHADTRCVELLLYSGGEIDCIGSKGRTPMHFAVQRGSEQLVLFLLRRGANARTIDEEGTTPVTLAVKRKLEGILELMLQRDATLVDAVEKPSLRAPLHFAVTLQYEAMIRMLIARGADVNARNARGQTPLHELLSGEHAAGTAPAEPSELIIRFLIEKGAFVNAIDENGQTLLHIAAVKGRAAVARQLLEAGADVKAPDAQGKTALHWAANQLVAEVLVEYGADIECGDSGGRRPLHDAAARGSLEVVRFLVEMGAQVAVEDGSWQTPRTLAGSSAVRDFLTKFELNPTAASAPATPVAALPSLDSGSAAAAPSSPASVATKAQRTQPRMVPLIHALLDDYQTLLNDSEFSDVTLLVESKPIYAHKAILVARCKYFRRMFSQEMKGDAARSHEFRIKVTGFRYPVFLAMLEYLYSCNVNITDDISLELFMIASKFGLDALRDMALEHLRRQLTPTNAVDMLRRAVSVKAELVRKLCIAFIAQRYHSIDNLQDITQDPDGAKLLLEIMDQAQGRRPSGSGSPVLSSTKP